MAAPQTVRQDKEAERAFFSDQAKAGSYQALTDRSNAALIEQLLSFNGLKPGSLICDLGCGSGVFTHLLKQYGLRAVGVDLCHPLAAVGQRRFAAVRFVVGDGEALPIRSETLDGILLSGLIHHLPDPSRLAREMFRVLKPRGVFIAFDPNRHNPFLWFYRDQASPFYSAKGVTLNERPITAGELVRAFSAVGFSVSTDVCSVFCRFIASPMWRWVLPLYNTVEAWLFRPNRLKRYRASVLTHGVKPCQISNP